MNNENEDTNIYNSTVGIGVELTNEEAEENYKNNIEEVEDFLNKEDEDLSQTVVGGKMCI